MRRRHSPPTRPCSTTATECPDGWEAIHSPADPAPRTTTSKCLMLETQMLNEEMQEFSRAALITPKSLAGRFTYAAPGPGGDWFEEATRYVTEARASSSPSLRSRRPSNAARCLRARRAASRAWSFSNSKARDTACLTSTAVRRTRTLDAAGRGTPRAGCSLEERGLGAPGILTASIPRATRSAGRHDEPLPCPATTVEV
jgi:hypothetical protein